MGQDAGLGDEDDEEKRSTTLWLWMGCNDKNPSFPPACWPAFSARLRRATPHLSARLRLPGHTHNGCPVGQFSWIRAADSGGAQSSIRMCSCKSQCISVRPKKKKK